MNDVHKDTLGIERRAARILSGCDTTTPRALGGTWCLISFAAILV